MQIVTSDKLYDQTGKLVPYRTINRVFGITTVSPSAFANWKTGFRNFVGGESKSYVKIVAKSRQLAMKRLETEALKLGADAIVTLRFDSDSITGDLETVVAYGTAVKIL